MNVQRDRGRRRRPLLFAGLALIGLLVASAPTGAAAQTAAPTFTAVGSVGQVYVTGVPPNAPLALITPAGKTLVTRNANSLGGALFRTVPPGDGYRVQLNPPQGPSSGPITVH